MNNKQTEQTKKAQSKNERQEKLSIMRVNKDVTKDLYKIWVVKQ